MAAAWRLHSTGGQLRASVQAPASSFRRKLPQAWKRLATGPVAAGGAERSPGPGASWKRPPTEAKRATRKRTRRRRRLLNVHRGPGHPQQQHQGPERGRRPGRPGPPATTLRGGAGKSDCQIDIPGWESEAATPPPAALTSPGPSTSWWVRRGTGSAWSGGHQGPERGRQRRPGSGQVDVAGAERPPSSSGRRPGRPATSPAAITLR